MKKSLFLFLLLVTLQPVFAQSVCPVIPLPNQYEKASGQFVINAKTVIAVKDDALKPLALYLQAELERRYKIHVGIGKPGKTPAISLSISGMGTNVDGYTLLIGKSNISISAAHSEGIFNGIITLLQLTTTAPVANGSLSLPCWKITDAPQFAWRGFLLDESRSFFGKEKVRSLLDWMAFYKLNRFHWHLTDMPGWRIEIKQYPLLTSIGGIGNFKDSTAPAKYYTQEDIKEIVAYANERFITVIPEVDMPGHAAAANRAYPEFSGGGSALYPNFTFNPGKEGTYQFLTNILKEVDTLFPSQLIHLGGDEVSYGNTSWDTDSSIQALMKTRQLADRRAVEDYFTKRMADTIIHMHNKIMAWDEIVTAGLPVDHTIVCWWRQDKPESLKLALDKGYHVILCPRLPMYFDFVQDSTHKIGRRWKKGEFNSLENVYNFNPAKLPAVQGKMPLILGIQACLWTETISNAHRLDFMIFPRIAALAEAAWAQPGKKDFHQFTQRLQPQLKLYAKDSLYYFDITDPKRHVETGEVVDEKKYID